MGNRRRHDFTLSKSIESLPDLIGALNRKLEEVGEAIEAQAGLRGEIEAASDLNMRGFRIKNVGKKKEKHDAVSADVAEENYGISATAALFEQFIGDLTEFDGADELFDIDPPPAVANIVLRWKKKSGWIARWDEPTTVNKLVGYWVSFFNDSAGTTWMAPEDGTSVADQATAERFVHENHFRTSVDRSAIVAPFTSGIKVRVVPVVKIKGHGKVRGPAADYGSLVVPGVDSTDDAAAATAVVGLALRWGAKKKGFKSNWQPPTTNWTSSLRYYKVAYSDNAGTSWMNPHDGTLAANEAAATIKVIDTHHTTHLERSELASAFAAGVKVKVIPVNTVAGVETDGTPSTSAFVGPSGEDTGPASAVQNLALRWGAKKKGFKATWDRPATNNISIQGYKVVFMNNAATHFMNPETGALASPDTEVGGTRFVHDDHYTTHLLQSDLASDFAAGVKVKVTAVNIVLGVETDGTSATSSFVAPSGENIAAPGAVTSLSLVWGRRHKGFKGTWGIPATNWFGEGNYYKVAYSDSAVSNWMNPHDGTLAVSEAAATIKVYDTHHTTHLVYTDLATQFQASVKLKVTPVNFISGVETDGTPTTTAAVAPGQDVVAIATGVPILPMGLERSNTSGTGHTSTTFVLDASANATNDYYNGMALCWTGAADPDDRARIITDYVGSTKVCTVATWDSTPVGAQAFEIHRGPTLGGKSGTGHSTTTLVLGSDASAVDDAYNGYTLMMPSADSADVLGDARIRRVTDYVGATKTATFESAVTSAMGDNDAYILWRGYVGYENADHSGKITGVPARLWGASSAGDDAGAGTIDTNIIEPINGEGSEWYTVNKWLWTAYKKSSGVLKKSGKIHPDNLPLEVRAPASGAYTPMFRLQAQNTYRLNSSDGKSEISYYFAGFRATGATTYSPDVYTPPDVDIYDEINWPPQFG